MKVWGCTTLVLIYCQITGVKCWHDEGHILTVAVARMQMPKEHVDRIEGVLRQWHYNVPKEFKETMDSSAVWLDRVACMKPFSFCVGVNSFESLLTFSEWHFTPRVYNPQNLVIPPEKVYYEGARTGAVYVVNDVFTYLDRLPVYDPNAAVSHYPDTVFPGIFGLNLMLRSLMHLIGDMHQPLHNSELHARGISGDEGGNFIEIDRPIMEHQNLHFLWDSCASTRHHKMQNLDQKLIDKMAKEIIYDNPIESFADRLAGDMRGENVSAISLESHNVSVKEAYKEFDFSTYDYNTTPVYSPSDEYIKRTKVVCDQQIAIGGYRLAYILSKYVVPKLPIYEQEVEGLSLSQNNMVEGYSGMTILIFLSTVCLYLPILIWLVTTWLKR